jgi:hypothetical protein
MSVRFFSHTKTVLVARGGDGAVEAEHPLLRDRLAAHLRAGRLDRALAEGVPPEASAALALRAQRLTEPDRRWTTAGALRRIVREAEADSDRRFGVVSPNRAAVRAACDALSRLADILDDPGPVAAHGVAQAWLLVTDAASPLYNPRSRVPLRVSAARAATQLRPWAA